MRPPRDMDIIEIELTNACIHRCSNCTRFCSHYDKPFFMTFETFRRAVDSMQGFQGTISLMGGEPTLHPDFERFARYLHEHMPKEKRKHGNPLIYPQKDMMQAIGAQNIRNMKHFSTSTGGDKTCVDGAGMFSSMGVSYMKNYEIIQDTLKFSGLNDHSNAMFHQPILISRKELGIGDDEWHKIRDNCWINMQWSASITPKGVFFCEIAGSMDMLFNGPGGLPIEKGWWKRDLNDFKEQMRWCEMCGMALQTYSRDANDEVDDVSPILYEKLLARKDKKTALRSINVISLKNGAISEESKQNAADYRGDFYSSSYSSRFTAASSAVFPKSFEVYRLGKGELLGRKLYEAICNSKDGNYIVILSGNRIFSDEEQIKWKQYVINPGTLHCSTDKNGFIALLNKNALSLRYMGMDRVLKCRVLDDLIKQWSSEKVVDFDTALAYEDDCINIDKNIRVVQYGAGNNGEVLLRELLSNGVNVVAVVDSDVKKQGKDFCGYVIKNPKALLGNEIQYDKVIIASTDYYDEIYQKLIYDGIPNEKIYDIVNLWN